MSTKYYKNSSLRNIYVSKDPQFGAIDIMQPRISRPMADRS